MPLSILEVILLKAYKLLYNAERVSLLQSIDEVTHGLSVDVMTQDPMLPSTDVASHRTLSSVCFVWWKVVTCSHWELRKQLLMVYDVVCIALLLQFIFSQIQVKKRLTRLRHSDVCHVNDVFGIVSDIELV